MGCQLVYPRWSTCGQEAWKQERIELGIGIIIIGYIVLDPLMIWHDDGAFDSKG